MLYRVAPVSCPGSVSIDCQLRGEGCTHVKDYLCLNILPSSTETAQRQDRGPAMEAVCLGRLAGGTCFVHAVRYPALLEFLLPTVPRFPRLGSRPRSSYAFLSESQMHSSCGSLFGCGHFVSCLQKRDCASTLLAVAVLLLAEQC